MSDSESHADHDESQAIDATDIQAWLKPRPLPKRGRGRPKARELGAPLYYEHHHKQRRILQLIQDESDLKSASALEQAFGVGSRGDGNDGKAWRRWLSGKEWCPMLTYIVNEADKKGWLPPEARELHAYVSAKIAVQERSIERDERLLKAQHALLDAVQHFREVCEEVYTQYHEGEAGDIPPLAILTGTDAESFADFPLNWRAVDAIIRRAEEAIDEIGRLEMNLINDVRIDPETGRAFHFGDKYKVKPGEPLPRKPWEGFHG